MKFPKYESTDRDNRHVTAMIHGIAKRERQVPEATAKPLRERSLRFGELCVALTSPKYENKHAARALVQKERSKPGVHGLHKILLDTVFFQTNAGAVARAQQDMHTNVIQKMKTAFMVKNEELGPRNGRLTELAALALLTRYAHPQMIAYPSLIHHEQDSNKPMHYDVGVSIASGSSLTTHLLQVKKPCLAACDEGTRSTQRDGRRLLDRYCSSIQLLSGCCELGIDTASDGNINPTLPIMLMAEYGDLTTPDEVQLLDNLSDKLLFDMTADLLPRGNVKIPHQVINLADTAAYSSLTCAS
jgi:hypothetical protein